MGAEPGVDSGIGEEDGEEVGAYMEDDRGEEDVGALVDPGQA